MTAQLYMYITQTTPHTEHIPQLTWRELPDVPYSLSAACVVDGVLLAIGGTEDQEGSKKMTSAIYALHPVDQKWQHVGDMPFEYSYTGM